VIVTLKHFVANSQETNRMTDSSDMSWRTLEEMYAPQYDTAIHQGGAAGVMYSYNRINSVYSCQDRRTLGMLDHQFGFSGFVVSDWGAAHSTVASAKAGMDIEMNVSPGTYYGPALEKAVQAHQVSMRTLNGMVLRILRAMFAVGVFVIVEAVRRLISPAARTEARGVRDSFAAVRTAAKPLTDGLVARAVIAERRSAPTSGGFDIAGAEAGWPPSRHLDAFQYLKRENFHITIHAGEAFRLPSIWEAVQYCGTERLGHGVRIVDDIQISREGNVRLGRLAAYIRDRRIPLEMCPTSNVQTGAVPSIAEHPLRVRIHKEELARGVQYAQPIAKRLRNRARPITLGRELAAQTIQLRGRQRKIVFELRPLFRGFFVRRVEAFEQYLPGLRVGSGVVGRQSRKGELLGEQGVHKTLKAPLPASAAGSVFLRPRAPNC